MKSKFKYDGKSRPTNDTYTKRWFEIFGKKEDDELKESVYNKIKYKPTNRGRNINKKGPYEI